MPVSAARVGSFGGARVGVCRVGGARAGVPARAASSPSSSLDLAGVSGGRVYNFSAGPACIYEDVLTTASSEMMNWENSGTSVMEMSHRGKEFMGIHAKAIADLRELLSIPDNYQVLFLQGGASLQFASIPLNLASAEDTADYVTTGSWGAKAIGEGKKFLKNANEAASTKSSGFTSIPATSEWSLSDDAKYVHICANETIQGVEFKTDVVPANGAPLIADMSSNFVSKPIDVSKYGIIYAGAQKNVGPAGLTVVIVRDDLIGNARADCPTMQNYAIMAENDSMYNTPPCYSIYMAGLVFDKLNKMGGLEAVEKVNIEKCAHIYDAIAGSDGFFNCPVDMTCRSAMNIPITIVNEDADKRAELEKAFIAEAGDLGMVALKGHRSVGGMRASIYNAMPIEGAEALAAFMKEFKAKHA